MKKQKFFTYFLLLSTLLILYPNVNFSQVLEEKVYHPSIRSVLLFRSGAELTPPIINYNTSDLLTLSFDDLDGGYTSYQYTFIHCNADWTPTDLWQNEYLSGYTEDYIRNYQSSFNTLQPYTHYSVEIPNENIRFRIPGNYLLKVYPDGNPDQPIFTKKFYVVDKSVSVNGSVKQATDINKRFTHHEVLFTISHPQYVIDQPFNNLKVIVLQNNRWDNPQINIPPLMIREGELDYRYTDGTIEFPGGNEFRYFDMKSIRSRNERIRSIEIRNDAYIVDLSHDVRRNFKPYISDRDINGKFLLKSDDASDIAVEGEYAWVNFFISFETPLVGGTMFVTGQFNDWKFDQSITPDKGRMKYNFARQGYEARVLLKQGYYNYLYAYVDDKSGIPDFNQAEGNHSETVNEYSILVYYREQGNRFDNLIAYEVIER